MIHEMQNLQASAEAIDIKKPQSKAAELQFLGHVLNTMFEEMVPETLSFGTDPNNDTRLLFGLYLNEIFQNESVIDSFGITGLLDKKPYNQPMESEAGSVLVETV